MDDKDVAVARQNIEDSFWLQVMAVASAKMIDIDKFAGNALRFRQHAQQQYKLNKPISRAEYDGLGFLPELMPIFAIEENGIVTCVGADEMFGWLRDRVEAGRNGAKKTNEKRWGNKQEPNDSARKSESANVGKSQQTSPSPSPSCSKNTNTNTNTCAFDIEAIYREYPKRRGSTNKTDGIEALRVQAQTWTQADYDACLLAAKNYKSYASTDLSDPKFISMFSTWCGSVKKPRWQEWIDYTPPETVIPLTDDQTETLRNAEKVIEDMLGQKPTLGFSNSIREILNAVSWDVPEFIRISSELKSSFAQSNKPLPWREYSIRQAFGILGRQAK